jgi:hypothetical protein
MSMSLQGTEMKTSLKCVLILITLAVCAASSTQSSTPPFALTRLVKILERLEMAWLRI